MSEIDDHPNGVAPTAAMLAFAEELRVLVGRLKRRLREHGSLGDLTPSQVAVIVHLERQGPATVTALARLEGMRPQSMGAIIAALQADGLIEGRPDPQDGRQTILSITDSCREQVRIGRAARQDWLARNLQAKLTTTEQERLRDAVELLKRLAEP